MTPLDRTSSIIPVLMITQPSGATASTQPPSVFTWSPGAVARGSAVIRLMSACSPAHTWASPDGASGIGG